MSGQLDMFNNEIKTKKVSLREEYIENPFSILDAKSGNWQRRKKRWLSLGIKSELGRDAKATDLKQWLLGKDYVTQDLKNVPDGKSVFDPVLCELMYKWFCPLGGTILDPFAGGSVRGIVANELGYRYTGIDIRQEQIDNNIEQSLSILKNNVQPIYICGDSNIVLDSINNEYDMMFSCPPYFNLEVYSDLEGDISNMKYEEFIAAYESIISKACSKLKKGAHAIFVVGEVRRRKNFCVGFVRDTYIAFEKAGMKLYNEMILSTPHVTAGLVANNYMKTKKVVKVHQNILDFVKP